MTTPRLKVEVRGGKAGFRALMGSLDVTRRFHRRDGVWRATLRRGRDFALGRNRLEILNGVGSSSRNFLATKPRKGLLRVRRLPARASLSALHLRGSTTQRIAEVRMTLNGHRVPRRLWPRGLRTFDALLGADEHLRFGRNRLRITAVSTEDRSETIHRTFKIARRAPLAGAGADRHTKTGRRVRLDGSSTEAPRQGWGVSYRWQIVRAPKGSKAKLRHARSARPLLTPDVRGRYVVRMVTASGPTAAKPGAATASATSGAASALPSATDQTTVVAAPAIKPIGMPVQTIAPNGGIELGGKAYTTKANWVQVLVLDRKTLEVTEELGFDIDEASQLTEKLSSLRSQDPGRLVIMSGGDRHFRNEETSQPINGWTDANETAIETAMATFGAGISQPNKLLNYSLLDSGNWSAIGVLGTAEGSATQNWGMATGGDGKPGSLHGYLQLDHYHNFGFVSPETVSIDTNVTGAKEGSNVIQVGEKSYSSETMPSGDSGFQVLELDSELNLVANKTFITDTPPGDPYTAHVQQMKEMLDEYRFSNARVPADLVIIQSIGKPGGYEPNWVNDQEPSNNTEATWGETLAAAIGRIGGPAAHDQFAQLIGSAYVQGTPPMEGGYTLVASTGLVDPFDSATSVSQAGMRLPVSGVSGVIARNRNSQWEVQSPSSPGSGFQGGLLAKLAYQPETAFPYNTGPYLAASEWIAERVGLAPRAPDVRSAYYEDSGDDWNSVERQVRRLRCPTGESFTVKQCETLQAQLLTEFPLVAEVWRMVENWQKVFTTSSFSNYVDLQAISAEILKEIERFRGSLSEKADLDVLGLGESFAWAAQALVGTSEELEAFEPGLGVLAAGLGIVGNFSTDAEGEATSKPVELPTTQLGQELVARYEDMAENLGRIGDILVSDWGKLQQAAKWSNGLWSLNTEGADTMQESLKRSSESTDYTGLLPAAFGEYVLQSEASYFNYRPWEQPWNYHCQNEERKYFSPFEATRENPGSYVIGARSFGPVGNPENHEENTIRQVRIITTPLEGEEPEWRATNHPEVLPQSIGNKLFAPITSPGGLGMDQFRFFADPAFHRWGLECKEGER